MIAKAEYTPELTMKLNANFASDYKWLAEHGMLGNADDKDHGK